MMNQLINIVNPLRPIVIKIKFDKDMRITEMFTEMSCIDI